MQQNKQISKRCRRQGFALLETALAITLVVLTAALGYPRMHAWANHRQLQMDRDRALHALRLTRRQAMVSGHCLELCLATEGSTCLGPASRLEISFCNNTQVLQTIHLEASLASWKGFRPEVTPGFNAAGLALPITGSLYLCDAKSNELAWRIQINRSGRIRYSEQDGACPVFAVAP